MSPKSIVHWLWHQFSGFLAHGAATVFFMGLWTYGKSLRDNNTLSYYWDHPLELVSPAAIAFLCMLCIALGQVVLKQRKTLASFGVRLFSQHDSASAKKSDWKALCEDLKIASAENSALWLLGATGKETFSGASAPLFDVLRNYQGEIKVLLIKPHSFAFENRCKSLGQSEDSYLDEILDSVDFCKELVVKRSRSVEVKLYEALPIWKMLMTTRALWVQYYIPGKHVDNTPLYCFEFKSGAPTLFEGYRAVFQKRWSHDNNSAVDLPRFVRSAWKDALLGRAGPAA